MWTIAATDFSKSSVVMRVPEPQPSGDSMASNLMKAALAVLVLGWAPVLLYSIFDLSGGNPLGLGVLAWLSVPVSLMLAAASGIAFLLQSWREKESRVGA